MPHCVNLLVLFFFLGGVDFFFLKLMGTVLITSALKANEHIRVSGQLRLP